MHKNKGLPLEKRIEISKEKLNNLMGHYNGEVNQQLISLSQELDMLIDEYYQSKNKK